MSARWSTEHLISEHRDLQANAMAVDQSGQLALLAGKRSLAVVKLNSPTEGVRKVARQSKWEINTVQWNPHASHSHWFVSACNQKADLWNWDDSKKDLIGSLRAHTRVISDLDWSPFNPTTLATSSVDTFTLLWDIRDIRKPTVSLQGISGVSQVKWNKVNSHTLATCHDGDIRIWDPRKGLIPVQYIAGHLSKIFGLDWSPNNENHLATSSQDSTVKFWDVTAPRSPVDKLTTRGSPVWRARYTPNGQGLVTVVLPQLRRGENSLHLWDLTDLREPAHTFVGHTDVILDFNWRSRQQVSSQCQLVTWSKDQTLRLWTMDQLLDQACRPVGELDTDVEVSESHSEVKEITSSTGGESPSNLETEENVTNGHVTESGETNPVSSSPVSLTPPRDLQLPRPEEGVRSPHQSKTLNQEIALVNFDNVTLDMTDFFHRTCTVSADSSSGKHWVKLTMIFPEAYPNKAVPSFRVDTASFDEEKQAKLVQALREKAEQHVRYSRSCIEPCLRQLVTQLDTIKEPSNKLSDPAFSNQPFSYRINTTHMYDQTIPFPRTSGARFSAAGNLVCFTRKTVNNRRVSSAADITPRHMGQLSAYSQSGQLSRNPLYSLPQSPPSDNSNLPLHNYFQYRDKQMAGVPRDRKKTNRSRSKSRPNEMIDVSSDLKSSPRKDKSSMKARVGHVIIYDVHPLLPIDQVLAENYSLDTSDMERMCSHNASQAAAVGRRDLVQVWSLVALVSQPQLKALSNPDLAQPWANHPFGRKMLKSLLKYYESIKDVQTLALVSCALGNKYDPDRNLGDSPAYSRQSSEQQSLSTLQGGGSPSGDWFTIFRLVSNLLCSGIILLFQYKTYHTVHPSDTSLKTLALSVSKMKRSSSLSDVLADYMFTPQRDPVEIERELHQQNSRLLEVTKTGHYDHYKQCYADILYRLGLLSQRAQVLKYVSYQEEPHKGIEFKSNCFYCGNETRGAQCWHSNCKRFAFRCDICHVAVKGASSFCLACGHGGHFSHMTDWFRSHDVCPTGCGCNCLIENPMVPERRSEDSQRGGTT